MDHVVLDGERSFMLEEIVEVGAGCRSHKTLEREEIRSELGMDLGLGRELVCNPTDLSWGTFNRGLTTSDRSCSEASDIL